MVIHEPCLQTDEIADADPGYDLSAMVIHIGSQPSRGHYISLVKSYTKWLLYDDESVQVCSGKVHSRL
jgi:ubiquitin C-terminal hydrolase